MKTLTVKLPAGLAAWLSRRAKESGCPQTQFLREALERARIGQDMVTCHDLMADVCGTLGDALSAVDHMQAGSDRSVLSHPLSRWASG